MIHHQATCNICRHHLQSDENDQLSRGLTLLPDGPLGVEYSRLKTSVNISDGKVHVCRTCLNGIRAITDSQIDNPDFQ